MRCVAVRAESVCAALSLLSFRAPEGGRKEVIELLTSEVGGVHEPASYLVGGPCRLLRTTPATISTRLDVRFRTAKSRA